MYFVYPKFGEMAGFFGVFFFIGMKKYKKKKKK